MVSGLDSLCSSVVLLTCSLLYRISGLATAVSDSVLPRSWIVSSYFSSYNRMSSAFSIQNLHSDRPYLGDTGSSS